MPAERGEEGDGRREVVDDDADVVPEQREVAEQVKERAAASGFWSQPIITAIVDAGPFTLAEEEHQDYLQKHPYGYTCHFLRD